MQISLDLSALGKTKWYEYALRFAFGGAITVAAGLIANKWGPGVGGLFLAFPAIFPASATLVEKHEKQEKQQHGLGRNNPCQGSRWPRRRWCGDRKYWSHGICCRRMAAYACSIDMAGDDLRHARLAHNLRRDLVSVKDARRAQRASQAPSSRASHREPLARERVTRRCDLLRAALSLRALLNFSAHVPPFPPRVHALWPALSRGPSSNRLP
jgi:uncharacterized protein DUF3147